MRDFIKVSAVLILIFVAIAGTIIFTAQHDTNVWNNGYCELCGGRYHLVTAEPYVYECEDCKHTIRTNSLMQ